MTNDDIELSTLIGGILVILGGIAFALTGGLRKKLVDKIFGWWVLGRFFRKGKK